MAPGVLFFPKFTGEGRIFFPFTIIYNDFMHFLIETKFYIKKKNITLQKNYRVINKKTNQRIS